MRARRSGNRSANEEPERREVAVYEGASFLGRILITGKTFASYDAAGRQLGVFDSQREALAAFNAGRA